MRLNHPTVTTLMRSERTKQPQATALTLIPSRSGKALFQREDAEQSMPQDTGWDKFSKTAILSRSYAGQAVDGRRATD